MSLQIEHLKNEISTIALALGIKKFDVYGTNKEENSASSKNKQPFSLTSSIKASLILRVWNDKQQVGVTRTSDLTHDGLKAAFELAQSSAEFGSLEETYDFSKECLMESAEKKNPLKIQKLTPIQDLAASAIEAEANILNSAEYFKSVPYNKVSESLSSRFYFNSIGAFKSEENQISFCYFYPLAQEKENKPRQSGHLEIANNFLNLNIKSCSEKAILKTRNHLKYCHVQNGKYNVVFSAEAFLDIINAFSNFMNAQNIIDKKSLSHVTSLGTQISASALSLHDSPLHPKNPSKSYFDEEGTPTREVVVIESGFLKNFIHSSHSASILKASLTGNANIGAKITVSPHFLHVRRSKSERMPKRDYLSEQTMVYIESVKSLHAGVNELQGSFSLPFDGFIIDKKELISIESATVAGDFMTLLQNIYYINDLEEITPSGISPEVWIKDLSITGI